MLACLLLFSLSLWAVNFHLTLDYTGEFILNDSIHNANVEALCGSIQFIKFIGIHWINTWKLNSQDPKGISYILSMAFKDRQKMLAGAGDKN